MKRFLLVLVVVAVAAFAVWFGMRGKLATSASSATVTTLLPRETLALIHLPDFNRTREQWHDSDLYKLWREPAVQAFLERPLSQFPSTNAVHNKALELEVLGVRDAFLALVGWENDQPKIAAGFRFKGTAEDAEKTIGNWRTRSEQGAAGVTRATENYQQHAIEISKRDGVTIATAYDGDWFLGANEVELLKTLLDRVDGRSKDGKTSLHADENYTAAMKHLPGGYAIAGYARVQPLIERLLARLPDGATNPEYAALRQIKTVAAGSIFENGKVRDVLFVAQPKAPDTITLSRSSLSLATASSFLYLALQVHFPKQLPQASPSPAPPIAGWPGALQRIGSAFAARGITFDDWQNAFGLEASVIGEWPETTRIPALLGSLPVKDPEKANRMITTVTEVADEDRRWTVSTKNGAQYYTLPPANPLMPIAPTIVVTPKLLLAGFDEASVDAALQRAGAGTAELATSQAFKTAEARVPKPTQLFSYVDTALLYARLDAALRPMLVMGAAFVPGIAQTVDLEKLPAPEIITKHLSPMVMSQDYHDDGYVTESVGPISYYQAAVVLAGATGAAARFYQHGGNPTAAPVITPSATNPATPSPSPDATDENADAAGTP